MRDAAWTRASARRELLGAGAVIAGLLVLGWGTFLLLVLPGGWVVEGHAAFGIGLAVTAFVLGVRHGFDVDHIVAIDTTTRALVAQGTRSLTVGLWFALGHSSVVFAAVALLSAGLSSLTAQLTTDGSAFTAVAGLWGVLFSAAFLIAMGAANLVSLRALLKLRARARGGALDERELVRVLERRGGMQRVLAPLMRRVDAPWKMCVVGFLFGLGFDTASTVALLALGGASAITAPWWVVLVLPILFASGMVIVDTLDGVVMHHAYAWAHDAPIRRLRYNVVVTSVSVGVAFLVAAVGLVTLAAERLGTDAGPLGVIAGLDLGGLGYLVCAVLVLIWLTALVRARVARGLSARPIGPVAD